MDDIYKKPQNQISQNEDYKQYLTQNPQNQLNQQHLQYIPSVLPINSNFNSIKSPQTQLVNDKQQKIIYPSQNMTQQAYTNTSTLSNYPAYYDKTQNTYNSPNNNQFSYVKNDQNNLSNNQYPFKQYESQNNFTQASVINQPLYVNKQVSAQSMQNYQSESMNQEFISSEKQQKQILELKAEIDSLKREHGRQLQEKDVQIFKLTLENGQLQDKLKKQQTSMAELENQIQQQKRQEEQKQQRRQRQREEAEIQRQIAYMMAIEMEQQNRQQQNPQHPDVDNMTYEELLNLGEQIGNVSKGMKQEDINKIKEVIFNKIQMKDICDMCSVCQSEFDDGEKVKELNPCKHFYHPECINQWLEKEKICPNCKQVIQV